MPDNEEIEELRKGLKKLKPRDRLRELRSLEQRRKEEIGEIEGLIRDSEKELMTETVEEEFVPQEGRNIGMLFEEVGAELEMAVREESAERETGEQRYISFMQAYGDYAQLRDITYASMMGSLTPLQMDAVDEIGERLDRSKYHSQSSQVANILVASRAALYKIRKYAGLE